MSTPDQLREHLFHAAADLKDPVQRAALLDAACGQDQQLRAEIEDLLRHDDLAGSYLNKPAVPGKLTSAPEAVTERPGMIIGPYKLLQQIGEGGMGVVWMAEQTQPVQRQVALKVIKPGMDSRQVIARFEAERQALAMMDHVNIARVFDGGTTGEPSRVSDRMEGDDIRELTPLGSPGRPYFVMELVHGVPITKYCDDNHLTPRERLELFVPVCQAIQHAHQKGIIHRDIKPSNVMVTLYDGKPVPKVIDFGVAKATEQKLTERTLFTQYGTMVGTLEYMSPEQAEMSALGVDTRSDIYSLGVLLYELLTGNTPLTHIRMKEVAYAEILRMIKEVEPPRPSTRLSDSGEALVSISANRHTEPAKLTKLVRGELDWIVMKTLEKDRNRRYETAKDFAADVQRYLDDEPVLACPPSRWYRFRKFARRNKRVLATAALFGVMLLAAVGAVTGTIGWAVRDRESREQDLARKAERDLALTEQGVRQAVEQAAKIRGELDAVLTKPGGVQELLNQPGRWNFLIQSAQSELAQARRSTARAETRLSAGLTQALHKLEEQLSGDEGDRLLALRLEKIRLDRATWVEGSFDIRKAAAEYPEAFAGFAVLKEDAAAVAARLRSSPINEQLVAALDDWALVALMLRNEPLAEQLLAVARQAAPDPAWADRLRQVKGWRDQEAIRKLVEEAPVTRLSPQMLALVGAMIVQQSAIRESWLRRAQVQYPADFWLNLNLGNALSKTHAVEAAGFFRVALAVRPANSTAYNNLGNVLGDQKKLPEAIAAYHKAIEIDPKHAYAHNNLGLALQDQGKLDEAIACYRKAIELEPKYVKAHMNLGNALLDQKKLDEAIACYRKVIDLDPKHASAHTNLGVALQDQGKLDEAIACYRKAIELEPKFASAYYNLGGALRDQKKLDEAIAAFRRALDIREKLAADFPSVPAYRHDLAWSHTSLGMLLKDLGQRLAAEQAYRRALDIREKLAADFPSVPAYRRELARSHNSLGMLLKDLGQRPAAEQAYRRALDIREKLAADFPSVPEYRRELAGSYVNFGNLLGNQGQAEASLAWFAKAIALLEPLVQQEPRQVTEWGSLLTARSFLRNAHSSRAASLNALARHSDAVKDWNRVLALNAVPADEPGIRRNRARSLARAGEHAKAIAEANALAEAKELAGVTIYNLARVCALASAAVKDDAKLQDQYAARAVELLRRAVAKGYKNVEQMKKDNDLDALRHREDFKRLAAELETKKK